MIWCCSNICHAYRRRVEIHHTKSCSPALGEYIFFLFLWLLFSSSSITFDCILTSHRQSKSPLSGSLPWKWNQLLLYTLLSSFCGPSTVLGAVGFTANCSFIHPFVHSFIQKVFIKHLLCAGRVGKVCALWSLRCRTYNILKEVRFIFMKHLSVHNGKSYAQEGQNVLNWVGDPYLCSLCYILSSKCLFIWTSQWTCFPHLIDKCWLAQGQ